LAKTDDVLLELRRAFAAYLKSFFPFQYENKTYRLVNIFVASPWMSCDVCGKHPIIEVSVIRSSDGQNLHVGNDCIDRIANRGVSRWFKNYRKKRANIMKNRKYIDGLSSLLASYEKNELRFQMSRENAEKLRKMFTRMCSGLNPTGKQLQLAECYVNQLP
jgi:hypothetical protein